MTQEADLRKPYDQETMDYFQTRLFQERVKVTARLQRNGDPIFVEELNSVEKKDRAQIVAKHNSEKLQDEKDLADIEAALKRIENGTYGVCDGDGCGEIIIRPRLEAIPTAKSCVYCQAKKPKHNLRVFHRP